MKAAIIDNGKVINIARVADQAFAEAQGWVVSDSAKIGDDYDPATGAFTTPPPSPEPVPQLVSRFQGRAALLNAGLLDQVETIVADPATDRMVKLAWQDATEFQRDSATLSFLAEQLGLTSDDVDDLFRQAVQIVA